MFVQVLIICIVKVNVFLLKLSSSLLSCSKKTLKYSKQIYLFFLKCLDSGSENTFYPGNLSNTKLYIIGCLKPLTTEPSITSHFKCILFVLPKFKIF